MKQRKNFWQEESLNIEQVIVSVNLKYFGSNEQKIQVISWKAKICFRDSSTDASSLI